MERKTLFNKRGGNVRNRPETFAITVEGYDTTAKPAVVHGKRLDTGEPATVWLRNVDFASTGNYKRPEIADFAAPRKTNQHPGTAIGGTLLVQEAFKNDDGLYAARWIQSLSHTPGEAEVFMATTHVTPVRHGKKTQEHPHGVPYALMTVLMDGDFRHLSQEMADKLKLTPPFAVDSVADLRSTITEMLKEELGVGVRVSNADGMDAMYVGVKRGVPVEQSVEAFMKDVEPIAEAIDAGEAKCEIIPFTNVFAGPATVDIMGKNKVAQSRVQQFNGEGSDERGRTFPVSVFRPAIVAVRLTTPTPDGARTVFFSHVEPVFTRQPVHGLVNAVCYAKTEVLAPEPPVLNSRSATRDSQATSASGPDSEPGGFDGGPMDDDLMTAAGGAPAGNDIGDDIPPEAEPEAAAPATPRGRSRYAGRR